MGWSSLSVFPPPNLTGRESHDSERLTEDAAMAGRGIRGRGLWERERERERKRACVCVEMCMRWSDGVMEGGTKGKEKKNNAWDVGGKRQDRRREEMH
eukprot:1398429-Rhodomonas_salina.1